jgi:hypothetical protein
MGYTGNPVSKVGRPTASVGAGQLTADERERQFQAYVQRAEAANATIRGDEPPWWTVPARVAGLAVKLGLPANADAMSVRRALFVKRYPA